MKTINLSTQNQTFNFFLTSDNDILFGPEITDLDIITHKIITDNFYVGTPDEWKTSIKYKLINMGIINE